ncbi:PIG-L deacetylase family protein [Kribbella sp. NPDC048928]|uniref:PIG-L deacetylase family protein n=1 Tax=Kribbella sp. NPDC048928 TaxID=3364111 RepID=UPI003719B2CE
MRTALVVHAHPDDEVFATGAATSVLSEQGWHVVLRVATAGMHGASDHLSASCALLGIAEWDWLGAPDQWIDDGGRNGPRTPAAADPSALTAAVEAAVKTLHPELILTVGSDGLTGHPDHIAISQAVQRARVQQAHVQCRVLGARVRTDDVRAGEHLVQQLAPGQQVGSGLVKGCDVPLETIGGASEQRRRQALDAYYDGLGSKPLEELMTTHRASSDGLLLRAVFDATGWDHDRFEELTSSSAAPSSG